MPQIVLVDVALPDSILAMLNVQIELRHWPDDAPAEIMRQAVGIFTYGHPRVDDALLDKTPLVRVVSNFGVGVDHIDLAAARRRGIPVGNTPQLVDGATADMTMALLLAVARNLIIGDRFARSPAFTHYDPSLLIGSEVHSATIGIIGMGNIGRQVAKRARAFDMRVLYHNRRRDQQAEAALEATYATLPELLAQSDYVTLNVPLTAETTRLIGREQLALMQPHAFLINAARGAVVDHAALYEALRTKQIAGAALDVTDPEPLPRDHPLLALENLVIAPHLGSATRQTRSAMARMAIDNLLAGLAGQALIHRVA
ncbi:MAG: D-glycerate dehydrogenase [Roseiflexaceae bacterium]|nr:D-glycerate dehydrogenase [Roseiflexaceae bacterium]